MISGRLINQLALALPLGLGIALVSAQASDSSASAVLEALRSHGLNLESADYARPEENEKAQVLPIPTRIHEIIQPTIGFPALVERGSLLPVSLQLNQGTRRALEAGFEVQITLHAGVPPLPDREFPEELKPFYANLETQRRHRPSKRVPFFSLNDLEEASKMKFSIPLAVESQKLLTRHLVLVARVPKRLPSHYNRVLSLEVLIRGPKGILVHDVQDHSVALTTSPEGRTFRFVHLADPQIGDEEFELNGADPHRRHKDLFTQRTVLRQAAKELNFLKPDFAVIGGDLVQGSNYQMGITDLFMDHLRGAEMLPLAESRYLEEYASIVQFLRLLDFPAFVGAGNHDGYAAYTSMTNAKDPGVRYSGSWIGREKPTAAVPVSQELLFDGFHFFRKMIGPRYFSFNFGALHFVMLDTYDMQRYFRLAYGFAAANSGGWMSREQMEWLEADLELATLAGKKIVLIGHHDPRSLVPKPNGGHEHRRPVRRALMPFREELSFQYSSFRKDPLFFLQSWMSPATTLPDNPFPEGNYDSAAALLELIAKFPVTHYLAGHFHMDDDANEYLGGKSVRFVHTTTLSGATYAAADRKGHWGYRVFEVSPSGELRTLFSGDQADSMEVGDLRFQVGYDDRYAGKAAGLLSASRPMPTWLPFSPFLQAMEKNRSIPLLSSWSDPMILSWSLLSPLVAGVARELIGEPKWSVEESKLLKDAISSSHAVTTRRIGPTKKPAQALFFNGNPEAVDGVLEIPLDSPHSFTRVHAQLLRASYPSKEEGFSLSSAGRVPLSVKTFTEAGRTYLQIPLTIPSADLGTGPYLYVGKERF